MFCCWFGLGIGDLGGGFCVGLVFVFLLVWWWVVVGGWVCVVLWGVWGFCVCFVGFVLCDGVRRCVCLVLGI